MAGILLNSLRFRPELSVKASDILAKTQLVSDYSSSSSLYDEDPTLRSTFHTCPTLSDSEPDSLLTVESSSAADSDLDIPERLPSTSSKTRICLKLDKNDAEFFAQALDEKPTPQPVAKRTLIAKPTRKRDKIRSALHRSKTSTPTTYDPDEAGQWSATLAKTLNSIHEDITEIIAGFDQIDQLHPEDLQSDLSNPLLTSPHQTFRERQRAKIEMIRMAHMLNPPTLLTYDIKESPYPYTDIVEPHGFHLLKMANQVPGEHLLMQHKPLQHRKLRYRSQRGLLRIRRDLRTLKHDLYGKTPITSHKELPSLYVQNYRNRLEKALVDVRQQISEYNQIHAESNTRLPSISQVIASMEPTDAATKASMEDYRSKQRPIVRFASPSPMKDH